MMRQAKICSRIFWWIQGDLSARDARNAFSQRNAVHFADPEIADHAVAIDKKGSGHTFDIEFLTNAQVRIEHNVKGQPVRFDVRLHGRSIFALVNADNFYLVPVALGCSLQGWEFSLAWVAPGRPKVEHHGCAMRRSKGKGLLLQVGECKRWRWVTDRWLRAAIRHLCGYRHATEPDPHTAKDENEYCREMPTVHIS